MKNKFIGFVIRDCKVGADGAHGEPRLSPLHGVPSFYNPKAHFVVTRILKEAYVTSG